MQRKIFFVLLSCIILTLLTPIINISANDTNNTIDAEYLLYPKVWKIDYQAGKYFLDDFSVKYGDSIDQYTKNRINETLQLQNIKDNQNANNRLIVVSLSDDDFDWDSYNIDKTWLSNNLDSYVLISQNNQIIIAAKNTDSAFYGATTLYHIFSQIENKQIRNFRIEDYADIATRGFIEGYYGNPWSVEDRIELMKWGGYYKLNAYIYAPKDDPKHNAQWRVLYTQEELKRIIEPQAKAGNESKNKFVYALHPYMYNPINLGSNYEKDFADLKAKFQQVIEHGVRQIAVLADDAANKGKNNYIKVLTDLTNWLKTEILPKYPDMSLTIPFCTQEYMGYGEGYYKDFPENVQIIMTGGKVWGTVHQNFGASFKNKTGRNVLYWINWPCSDNSKKHLIMGGFADFLQPGVDKNNVDGIILNPMQQSEPSKVAIFGNAVYSWKMWKNRNEADDAWKNSFAFVDHNNVLETESSNALRNLSKHMINQAMDGRVVALKESLDIKDLLSDIKNDLKNDVIDLDKINQAKEIFIKLNQDALKYQNKAINQRVKEQIIFWLNCYKDTTNAALSYLEALESIKANDQERVILLSNSGNNYFNQSKTYGFHYVDHIEYAEVGVEHIVPFLNTISDYIKSKVKVALDPNAITQKFITSRTDNPVGKIDYVFDNKNNTLISYRDGNQLYFPAGTYVGVMFNKLIPINNIEFVLGAGKNHFENAKLEYTQNGKDWSEINLVNMPNDFKGIKDQQQIVKVLQENLNDNFKAMGIRLITTKANTLDAYLDVHEIRINQSVDVLDSIIEGNYTSNRQLMGDRTDFSKLKDDNSKTEVWLSNKEGNYRDKLQAESYVNLKFDKVTYLKNIIFSQGGTNKSDIIDKGVIEYYDNGQWKEIGRVDGILQKDFDVSGLNIETDQIRVRNLADKAIWWRLGEFYAKTGIKNGQSPIRYEVIKTDSWSNYNSQDDLLHDGDDNSFVWYDPDGSSNKNHDNVMVGDFLGYNLGKIASLSKVHVVVGAGDRDKLQRYAIQYSTDGITWNNFDGYADYRGKKSGKDIIDIHLDGLKAQYLRIYNLEQYPAWVKFSEFSIVEQLQGSSEYSYGSEKPYLDTINSIENGTLSFSKGATTLNNNQFVGFKLKHIEEITAIQMPDNLNNIKVQVAKHPDLFSDYNPNNLPIDARYIRFISSSDNTVLDLSQIKVFYKIIYPTSISSDFDNNNARDVRTKNNLQNVFDGNLSTSITLAGPQKANKEVLFDLGQSINLTNLKYYINENSKDFPRSMDILVSDKIDGQFNKILHIGPDQVDNSYNELTAKSYEDGHYLLHDSKNPGNMFAEAANLNQQVRYIKFKITSDYTHRWLEVGELLVNNGEYISVEPHKDIISNSLEEKGHYPSLALDQNYETYYKLSKKDAFIYRISDANQRSVRIVQLGQTSFANVIATVLENGQLSEKKLGVLGQTINEFSLTNSQQLVEIKIEFNDQISNIVEIVTGEQALSAVDKSELKKYLDMEQPYDNWTKNSQDEYNKAKKVAQSVFDNENVNQVSIDQALSSLKSAINRAKVKGNYKILEADLDSKVLRIEDDIVIYTANSYAKYESVLQKIENALNDKDNLTAENIESLHNQFLVVQKELKYDSAQHDKGQSLITNDQLLEKDYTQNSYRNYKQINEQLEEAVNINKNPKEISVLIKAYNDAKKKLVNISELVSLSNRQINQNLYTKESYVEYKNLIDNKLPLILESGSREEVLDLINELKTVLVAIDYQSELNRLEALDANNYTSDSYGLFKQELNKIKKLLADENTREQGIEQLSKVESKLINCQILERANAILEKLNVQNYIKESQQLIDDLKRQIQSLKNNGSLESINDFDSNFDDQIDKLVLNSIHKQSEFDSIKLIDNNNHQYRDQLYKDYYDNYQAFKSLDLKNTPLTIYEEKLLNLNNAQLKLVKALEVISDSIKANVKQVAVYDGKQLLIKKVNDDKLEQELKELMPNYEFAIYDIKLMDGNKEVEVDPNYPLKIYLELSDKQLKAKETIKLWHIHDNRKDWILHNIEDDFLVFETKSLSYFVIAYNPKTNNNSEINSNIVIGNNDKTDETINNKQTNISNQNDHLPNTGFSLEGLVTSGVIIVILGLLFISKKNID